MGEGGGQEYPFAERGSNRLHDQIWVHRRLGNQSFYMLEHAADKINASEAVVKKLGGYTLTVLYPAEIYRAIRQSRQRNTISAEEVYNELIPYLPQSAGEPITAAAGEIQQFATAIAVEVDYPAFQRERQAIETGLSDILKIRYMRKMTPHISFAKGNINNLTNRDDIEAVISSTVELSPMYNGMSTGIKH